ncbi:ABC transporter ATP-binding protein [Rummeliibacillus sp. POC4]|uniref:ABC transporter ATP-binding protein n=1 Tax=Rummeliibacillus sp. POC4 TaxID=2305899 RepID=UPI000E66FB6E|nr:ABC transporter ATP-binding protein [Rummeliibacillus sp. POC4]RIJ66972.1 ABC transporter ATP-binding protein [Rummeliibacillus sp. POC4]
MITLKNVSLDINENTILKSINLELEKGKVYGLLGPNGAGKTTLFKTLLDTIKYKGDILRNPENITIGKLIEYPAFYPNLTCIENLKLHASYADIEQDDSSINELLRIVGLVDAKQKKFKELSMGMKQRLGVAKALMGSPDLLLLDEPTNGLDPIGMKDMRDLVERNLKNKERVILISSHNLNEVSLITDTLLFMRNGEKILEIDNEEKIYMYGKVQHIENNIKKDITLLENSKKETYFIASEIKFNNLLRGKDFIYKDVEKLTLEDLYIKLMSSDLIEVTRHA